MASLPQNKYEYSARTTMTPRHEGTPGNAHDAKPHSSPHLVTNSEMVAAPALSIALIGPNDARRAEAVLALDGCAGSEICEFCSYPTELDAACRMLEETYDVIIIDLDSDPEYALDLVESIASKGVATAMVYSSSADPEILVRCMRAGSREFLTIPFSPGVMAEALVRAAARRPVARIEAKAPGRMLTFMGAKGGAGATMLACNFAVALAQDKSQKTLLIDLDLPLGDAALNLGIVAEYSTIEALQAGDRLDSRFLDQLLVAHSSGLSVLAAPGRFVQYQASDESIERLISVARSQFDNVVIDVGAKLDLMGTAAYHDATAVYLVTQASIPELRNSNRLVSQFFSGDTPKLEIVINRYEARTLGLSEEHIAKALTRPVQWKIPNDFAAVRKMQIDATPLVLEDSPITRQIRKMASTVIGETGESTPTPAKKKGFRLF